MSETTDMGSVTTEPRVRPDPRLTAEVWSGLMAQQKELSPKHFYDARGAALFEEITELPEYYLTRTERVLLECWAPPWMRTFSPRSLVELGAGSADKTRILLDAMARDATYVPVDISTAYLEEAARSIGMAYPQLRVIPAQSDISADLMIPAGLPRPALFAFLGSTIGNFDAPAAVRLLRHVAHAMALPDRLLLGADLKKDREVLELAYNDARGITAEFNRNILRVLNREAGTNFDAAYYDHLAYYATAAERIEMHLVARTSQEVDVPGHGTVTIDAGESIRTEISCKYDHARVTELFAAAGLEVDGWTVDPLSRYALAVGRLRT